MMSNPTSSFKWTEGVPTAKLIRKVEAAAAAVGYPEYLRDGLLIVVKPGPAIMATFSKAPLLQAHAELYAQLALIAGNLNVDNAARADLRAQIAVVEDQLSKKEKALEALQGDWQKNRKEQGIYSALSETITTMLGGLKTQLVGDRDLGLAEDQASLPTLMDLLRARQARDVAAASNYITLDHELQELMAEVSLSPLTAASTERCQMAATKIIDFKSKWTDLGQGARVVDKVLRDYYIQTSPADALGENRLREEMEALPEEVPLAQWFQTVLPLVAKRAKYLSQRVPSVGVAIAAYSGQSKLEQPAGKAMVEDQLARKEKAKPAQPVRKIVKATPADLIQWSREWTAGNCGGKCKMHPELSHPLIECDSFQRQYRALAQDQQDASFIGVLNAGLISRYSKSA